jgi:hypothetical protein
MHGLTLDRLDGHAGHGTRQASLEAVDAEQLGVPICRRDARPSVNLDTRGSLHLKFDIVMV